MKVLSVRSIAAILLAFFAVGAVAAIHPVLQEAERLALAGAPEQALTEYKRYLFFNRNSFVSATAVYRSMADLYRSIGRPAEAQDALASALSSAVSDSLRDAIRIESSILDIAQGKYASAQMELLRISSFSEIPSVQGRARLFLCIAHVSAGEWDKAENVGHAGTASGDLRRQRLIDSLLKSTPHNSRHHRKSPAAAKWMSTVLPGLGQVYAGDVKDGLNALAISAVTGFMTVHSILFGYYQEAIFTDITLFWRYYSGNRWHASEAALRYNAQQDRAIRKNIMKIISQTE